MIDSDNYSDRNRFDQPIRNRNPEIGAAEASTATMAIESANELEAQIMLQQINPELESGIGTSCRKTDSNNYSDRNRFDEPNPGLESGSTDTQRKRVSGMGMSCRIDRQQQQQQQ